MASRQIPRFFEECQKWHSPDDTRVRNSVDDCAVERSRSSVTAVVGRGSVWLVLALASASCNSKKAEVTPEPDVASVENAAIPAAAQISVEAAKPAAESREEECISIAANRCEGCSSECGVTTDAGKSGEEQCRHRCLARSSRASSRTWCSR
jgi:hypothetical protein